MDKIFISFIIIANFISGIHNGVISNKTICKEELVKTRITDGITATPHEFPYIVSIQAIGTFTTKHICGGSILNEEYIITAAQCVHTQQPYNLRIVAGEHNLMESSGIEQIVSAESLILHQDYNPDDLKNDIAIIKLSKRLNFESGKVQQIQIATHTEKVGTMCQVAGWGATSECPGSTEAVLRKTSIPIISDVMCKHALPTKTIMETMLCAGEGNKGHCFEDEGGPLVCNGNLQGLVSYGEGCGNQGSPGVYTELSHFNNWLKDALSFMKDVDPGNATVFTL